MRLVHRWHVNLYWYKIFEENLFSFPKGLRWLLCQFSGELFHNFAHLYIREDREILNILSWFSIKKNHIKHTLDLQYWCRPTLYCITVYIFPNIFLKKCLNVIYRPKRILVANIYFVENDFLPRQLLNSAYRFGVNVAYTKTSKYSRIQ